MWFKNGSKGYFMKFKRQNKVRLIHFRTFVKYVTMGDGHVNMGRKEDRNMVYGIEQTKERRLTERMRSPVDYIEYLKNKLKE